MQQFLLKTRFETLPKTLLKKDSQRRTTKRLPARLYEGKVRKYVPKVSQLGPQVVPFLSLFRAFGYEGLLGGQVRPKVPKRHQNQVPRSPKWRPGVPNWSPKVFQSTKKVQKCTPRCKNVGAGARSPTMPKRHHEATQNGIKALG